VVAAPTLPALIGRPLWVDMRRPARTTHVFMRQNVK